MGTFSDAKKAQWRLYFHCKDKGVILSMVLSELMTLNEISNREERKAQLFVTVSTYRAKAGEEDAIIALHEDWQRRQGSKAKVYISWELLRNIEAPREFIVITYFANEELARAMVDDLNQDAWYSRLVSLIEEGPKCTDCRREWQLT